MTVKDELEILAKNCEECAEDAEREGDKGLQRAWMSVAYRIRHAAKRAFANRAERLLTDARHELDQQVKVNVQQNEDIEQLRTALRAAKEKLALYRAERTGEYTGGMEYMALMRLIDEALAR